MLEKPIAFPGGAVLTFKLDQKHGGWNSDDNQNNNLGRFRFSVTDAPDADGRPAAGARPDDPRAAGRAAGRPEQAAAVFRYWRTTVPRWKAANDRIEALWKQHPEGSSQLVLKERDAPRETHLLRARRLPQAGRGGRAGRARVPAPAAATDEPAQPARLRPMAGRPPSRRRRPARSSTGSGRRTSASGWSRRSEDLGSQCEAAVASGAARLAGRRVHGPRLEPQAPAPADRDSATYRQSSRGHARAAASAIPYNRLLARGPRFRVDAEVVRDIALAASGLLNPTIGGPSVYPPAPAFLFQPPASYGPKAWNEATGPDRYRRALYTFRYRSVPYPMLQTFDAPNGDFSCVRRARSNTPLQALTTLNEPLFLECARALARRDAESGATTDADRLTTPSGAAVAAGRRSESRGPARTS